MASDVEITLGVAKGWYWICSKRIADAVARHLNYLTEAAIKADRNFLQESKLNALLYGTLEATRNNLDKVLAAGQAETTELRKFLRDAEARIEKLDELLMNSQARAIDAEERLSEISGVLYRPAEDPANPF